MPTFSVDVRLLQTNAGRVLETEHTIEKKESIMRSIVQGIGLLYHMADEVAHSNPYPMLQSSNDIHDGLGLYPPSPGAS